MIKETMTVSPKLRGWTVACVFGLLDVLLLALHKDDVPSRDLIVWAGALVVTYFLVNRAWKGAPVLSVSMDEFHRKGRPLEIIVAGLIVVPWIQIVAAADHSNAISLLAPHLFVLQSHVVGEGIIETGGESKVWLMFIFTCLASAYRLIPLTIWLGGTIQQIRFGDDSVTRPLSLGGGVSMLLPAFALLVWLYWSLYYIPNVWYPLLERPKKAA